MRRFQIIARILLFVIAICGCSSNVNQEDDATTGGTVRSNHTSNMEIIIRMRCMLSEQHTPHSPVPFAVRFSHPKH